MGIEPNNENLTPALRDAFESLLRGKDSQLGAYLTNVHANFSLASTKASLHCHFVSLDGNGLPRVQDLARYLASLVIDYAIPRSEIKTAQARDLKENTTRHVSSLRQRAAQLFSHLKKSGEGGELLLYVLLSSYLRIPQILCKMSLKTNSEMHLHGTDGVHATVDDSTGNLVMYWGESKLYSNFGDAIAESLESIEPYVTRQGLFGGKTHDLQLVKDNVSSLADKKLEQALLKFLDPDDPLFNKLEFRGACLVGFDASLYPKGPSSKTAKEIEETIKVEFAKWQSSVSHQLSKRSPLGKYALEVFLIPFPDVDAFRRFVRQEIGW